MAGKKMRIKEQFKGIHLCRAVYPDEMAAVDHVARAENRSAAQAAAILIGEAWAARQARRLPTPNG